MLKRVLGRLLIAFAILGLGACATQGARKEIAVTMPGGERATIVAHEQSVPDWLLDRGKLKLNYLVKSEKVSEEQLKAVAETERACRIYTATVRPHTLVAVLTNGALYALTGYVGLYLGSGALRGVTSAMQQDYGEYGGFASGASGATSGMVSNRAGNTYTFENCGAGVMRLFPGYQIFPLNRSPS